MKLIVIFMAFAFTFISSKEIVNENLDVIKCLLESKVLLDDVKRVIELVKEGNYQKLIIEVISMLPEAYSEFNKCLNKEEVNLLLPRKTQCEDIGEGRQRCCWMNSNTCCDYRPGQVCGMAITKCCKVILKPTIDNKSEILIS